MSVVCPNCKKALSCGCKKRTASDGTKCCTSCLASYEAVLKKNTEINTDMYEGVQPNSVRVIYNGPLE